MYHSVCDGDRFDRGQSEEISISFGMMLKYLFRNDDKVFIRERVQAIFPQCVFAEIDFYITGDGYACCPVDNDNGYQGHSRRCGRQRPKRGFRTAD